MLHGTVNGGIQSPPMFRDDPVSECCAKCRRGTKALKGPCGYDGACPRNCHQENTSTTLDALKPVSGPHTRSSIPVASTGHTATEGEEI